MGHTRGGGLGNMAGGCDQRRHELVAELRQRSNTNPDGLGDITVDELSRLIGRTTLRNGPSAIDLPTVQARLEWLPTAERGSIADWSPANDWHKGIAEVAAAALDQIRDQDVSFPTCAPSSAGKPPGRSRTDVARPRRPCRPAAERSDARALSSPRRASASAWVAAEGAAGKVEPPAASARRDATFGTG
ncbi:hypothetical protein ABIF64_001732 [Bradyrhizobium japonicum]|uniref:hypothetical protein n=1 Tax=Bradyrhizobium japonicum TaxID=375 RepID=UPI001BA48B89|nr:hypothetical protein [Bradyrhizobium japonicum]MBR0731679.1 hypothetical protein [Bradyrhizobium japonicum]